MRLREKSDPLSPEAERELEALDRALTGEPVDAEHTDLAELTRELRAGRPEPTHEFAAELDERAGEGFPGASRGSRLRDAAGSTPGGRLTRRLRDRIASTPPGRLLAPAGFATILLVAVAVGVSQIGGGPDDGPSAGPAGTSTVQAPDAEGAAEAVPPDEGALDRASKDSSGVAGRDKATAPAFSVGETRGGVRLGREARKLDRDASLTLSTGADEVRDVTDEVVALTRGFDGVVRSSRVSEDANRGSRAQLQLVIPARNLDDALTELTGLAHVESFEEATQDITRRFVSAQEKLRDARDERDRLLEALAGAATAEEAEAIREQIRDIRRKISRLRADFENVDRRARLADVSVSVVGNGGGGIGEWSIGDALEDAGDVLRVTAGIAIVTAAIVVPLAIIAFLAWLAGGSVVRRQRERALDTADRAA